MNRSLDSGAPVTLLHRLLADLIRDSGISQRDLAAATGFTEKHVSFLMTGRQEGSLAAWQALLDAAGITVLRPQEVAS